MEEFSLKNSAHPCLITWDLIFKFTPIGIYIFSFTLPNSLIVRFSFISILSAIEFWFTKNILGRVLVGLKWDRVIEENGTEYTRFETKRSEEASNKFDYNFFWGLLGVSFIIWLVLFFINILSFSNLMIIILPLILLGTNLYCFFNCSKKQ